MFVVVLENCFAPKLNQRLYIYFEENKILHNSQIGFLSENRTADHVFTLRTLIDKYIGTTIKRKSMLVSLISARLSTPFGTRDYFVSYSK